MTATALDIGRRWYPLRELDPQIRLCQSTARFDVIEAGRRCLAEGTLVATPTGPRTIESLRVGDEVIGFDGVGPVITHITKTWDNGDQEVVGLYGRDRCYVEATKNHKLWACNEHAFDKRKPQKEQPFDRLEVGRLTKRTRVCRTYLGAMITGGPKHVDRTYSLGALLGDGCSRENKTKTGARQRVLAVSSEDGVVPQAIAMEVGGSHHRRSAQNCTWAVRVGRGVLDAVPFYREWCAGRYAHEKTADWEEIDTWDRSSCLAFLAGVIDTDGSIYLKDGGSQIVITIGMQAVAVVEACQNIIAKYFQEQCTLHVDRRAKYKNGPVYYLRTPSNDLAIRVVEELQPYLRKRGKMDLSAFKRTNIRSDRIGLLHGGTRTCRTYDITVALPSNLYVLHLGGIVTSNSCKTELVKRLGIEEALRMAGLLGMRWYTKFCAPTLRQAKDIFWDDLCDLSRAFWTKEPNKSDLCIFLEGGAELWVCGLDKPQRIEGSPTNRIAVDELADVKDGAWDRNIRPALDTEQPGYPAARGWLLGVPRPGGQFAKLAKLAKDPLEPDYAYHTWPSELVLTPEKIAAAKRTMDPLIYAQEYLAQRVSSEGRAYYTFTEDNLRDVSYDPRLPLMFCFDFNRSPGVAVVAQEQSTSGLSVGQCYICGDLDPGVAGASCKKCRHMLPLATVSCAVGEVHIPQGSNTTMVCARLARDWGHHKGQIYVYGDAAGGAKTTSSVEGSDWDLIRAHFARPFPQAVFDVDRANPSIRARVNSVNLRACNAAGERRMFTNPRLAPNLTRDLQEQLVVSGGTGELDKDSDKTIGHAADGWGYAIHKLYPAAFGNEPTIEAY